MIIDGRAIATLLKGALKEEIEKMAEKPSLAVFVVGGDLATDKFIALKQSFARDIGVSMFVKRYSKDNITTQGLIEDIKSATGERDGVVVQFPLPDFIDKDLVRNSVPSSKDVDLVSDESVSLFESGKSKILPPVVGAIKEILDINNISIKGKEVVVVGEGRLVGKPSAVWARQVDAKVETINAKTEDISTYTKNADVLILGAGVPGLIKPEMIKDGAIVLDAGTSEAEGKLAGDADQECGDKASFFTPVPGGIGPITVAMIFKNLLGLR